MARSATDGLAELASLQLSSFDFSLADFDGGSERASLIPEAGPTTADSFPFTVYRPALNKKRTARFLSVRRWRSEQKEYGIERMKTLKAECSDDTIDAVAGEFEEILSVLVGGLDQFAVTAPPSSKPRRHFATEIARRFADRTHGRYVSLFNQRLRTSSSHPAHWDQRGDMERTGERVPDRLLLLDDIATSGTTIEQAVQTLRDERPATVILPIAWIYENVAPGEDVF